MGQGDAVVYNFSGINTAAGSIATFVKDMNQTLSDVDKTFRALLAEGWSGSAADAFQGLSAKWHDSANQMAATLQQLSQKVGDAAVNMQEADRAAAARF